MMTIREILSDIHALEEDLLDFKRKYGVSSETLYAAYVSGEEPEDDTWMLGFGEWASVYRTWLTKQAESRNQIQRIQRKRPSLAGLIPSLPPSSASDITPTLQSISHCSNAPARQ